MKIVKIILGVLGLLGLLGIVKGFATAQETASKQVTATVKISVCGNGTIEGGEDCEAGDLNSQTCVSLGYASGTLTCDIACSYDTTGCLAATPTPTPTSTSTPTPTPTPTLTPTPTSTPTPTPTPTSAPAATSTPAPAAAATATSVPAATSTPIPAAVKRVVPAVVAVFDADASGRIEVGEVLSVVKSWVEEWKAELLEEIKIAEKEGQPAAVAIRKPKKCDINRDGRCDLFDLSVLLYYIGR